MTNITQHKEVCSQPNCDYVALHEKPAVAKRMLGMHKRKHHGIIGRDSNASRRRRTTTVRGPYNKAARNGNVESQGTEETVVTIPIDMVPNFCFHCGAPQKHVAVSNLAHSKRG